MSDRLTPLQRHTTMSHIRGKNTTPELKVRRWLHANGFRFRINIKRLHGSPDIVLAKYRTCIFVNGCFWHGHDLCRLYTHPKTNPEFWENKVLRNKERDETVRAKLESMGWSVVTIWECELKKDRFEQRMQELSANLQENREQWQRTCEKKRAERQERLARNKARLVNVPASIVKLSKKEEQSF